MQMDFGTPEELLGDLNEVESRNAPDQLYYAGDPSLLRFGTRVSIVGSRKASPEGVNRASRPSRILVEQGAIVVSGLAEGIDAAAHEAAMLYGGRTIAVVGTPLDECYPAKHRDLQARIASEHLVLSQFAVGTQTNPGNFPKRNRTMALISEATIIVEAGSQSGTEHQGWEAIRLGRELFLLQSLAEHAGEYEWVSKLLQYGACVLSDDNCGRLLSGLPERDAGVSFAF